VATAGRVGPLRAQQHVERACSNRLALQDGLAGAWLQAVVTPCGIQPFAGQGAGHTIGCFR